MDYDCLWLGLVTNQKPVRSMESMQSAQRGAEWLLCAARVCTVYASCAKGAQRSRVVARCTEWLLGVQRCRVVALCAEGCTGVQSSC